MNSLSLSFFLYTLFFLFLLASFLFFFAVLLFLFAFFVRDSEEIDSNNCFDRTLRKTGIKLMMSGERVGSFFHFICLL